MKWKFWKKVVEHEPVVVDENRVCVHCGKHVLRQTTLKDFADMAPPEQTRLFPVEHYPTQRVGMGSKTRRYRGGI